VSQTPLGGAAGREYPAPAPLPPFVRFLIAAFWTAVVFWGSGLVYLLFPGHNLLPGVLFRVVGCVLTAAGFVFFLRVLDGNFAPPSVALGLPLDRIAGRQWLVGCALGGLFIGADVLCIAIWGSLRLYVHFSVPMLLRAGAVAVLLLSGALMEELSFRGYPFQKLTETFGAFGAVLVLSALFGAVHLNNPEAQGWLSWSFFNTIGVGVVFALARIRSGSLWFPFGLHFGWNLFQGAVFGLPVSGLTEFHSLITASVRGPVALTGGGYGPEASATCSMILVAAIPLVWIFTSTSKIQHRPASHLPASSI
jgi:membrane protease YdiL (CAAX protease family)